MGKPTGFLEIPRKDHSYKPVKERIKAFKEFKIELSDDELNKQGARCMDCGIPFCHEGCPVNNIIPDWNDLVYKNEWREALDVLHSTNNFPEFTGRICPAPCEASCTLNLTEEPVTIKTIECAIVDKGWENDWIKPLKIDIRTGKSIAIVGAGPAGMAAAQQLCRAGHAITVFERQSHAGGLLRFGIPDFKLNKSIVQRRVEQMEAEGVVFKTGVNIGVDIQADQLQKDFDAVLLTGGSEKPRDLPAKNREVEGIHFAMDFLRHNTRQIQGLSKENNPAMHAKGKHVVVIGGGDTGSDCIGTSIRQGAKSVTQLEIMPEPPEQEDKLMTWPEWPNKQRTSTSQAEGCKRLFATTTKEFIAENGKLKKLICANVEWIKDDQGQFQLTEVEGSEFELPAELVTLAMGFVHPVHENMLEQLKLKLDPHGNVEGSTEGEQAYETSVKGVFSAGDMRRGQSLVVWAIREGRQAAHAVDSYLMGSSVLPR